MSFLDYLNPSNWRGFGTVSAPQPEKPPLGEQSPAQGAYPTPGVGEEGIGAVPFALDGYGPRPAGTYRNYNEALRDPVLALARAVALNPIRTAKWSVGRTPDADPKIVAFYKNKLLPLRDAFVDDALWAVDLGWQGWQKTWEIRDGQYVPTKLSPCEQELTTILINKSNGEFAGLEWRGIQLVGAKSLIYTYGRKGKYHYGRSRLENVIQAIWDWRQANNTSAKLGTKASGILAKIGYPPGQGTDASGKVVSRSAQADTLGKTLTTGAGYIKYPTLGGLTDDQIRTMKAEDLVKLLAASLWQIDTFNLGSNGAELEAITADKLYLDKLKCYGYLVPARAILEGEHGTQAEAGVHADAGTIANEPVNQSIAAAFSKGVGDEAVVLNFGDEHVGTVWIEAEPLEDAQASFDQKLVLGAMQQQSTSLELYQTYDFDAVMDRNGVPKRATPLVIDTPAPPPTPATTSRGGLKPESEPTSDEPGAKAEPSDVKKQPPSRRAPVRLSRDDDEDGEWRTINGAKVLIDDSGRIAKGPSSLVGKHASEVDTFHGDEQRAAARSYVDVVNDRVSQSKADARDAGRQYVAQANADFARRQGERPESEREDHAEADGESAVESARGNLSPEHASIMADSHDDHSGSLRDAGELQHSDTEDFRGAVHDQAIEQAPQDVMQQVPREHRDYVAAHTDRINEALQDTGRLNADKVFSETDDGVKAIPEAAARQVIETANAHYAPEKARIDVAEAADEEGDADHDEARQGAAEAAVREAAKGLKGTARQRVLDEAGELASHLVVHGKIDNGFFGHEKQATALSASSIASLLSRYAVAWASEGWSPEDLAARKNGRHVHSEM